MAKDKNVLYPDINRQLQNMLSDHIEQIATIKFSNGEFRIVSHNMMEQCTGRNNAYGAIEPDGQYIARLNYLKNKYIDLTSGPNGVIILGLQETSRSDAIRKSFISDLLSVLNLNNKWSVAEQMNGRGQPMLMFYNESKITCNGFTSQSMQKNIAQIGRFTFKGNDIILIQNHLASTGRDVLSTFNTKTFIEGLMVSSATTVRFGDHNGDTSKYPDLITDSSFKATCISRNIKKGEFYDTNNRYDGFAYFGQGSIDVDNSPYFQLSADLKSITLHIVTQSAPRSNKDDAEESKQPFVDEEPKQLRVTLASMPQKEMVVINGFEMDAYRAITIESSEVASFFQVMIAYYNNEGNAEIIEQVHGIDYHITIGEVFFVLSSIHNSNEVRVLINQQESSRLIEWSNGELPKPMPSETIENVLPVYKQYLLQIEFIDILSKLYPRDYPVRYEDWTVQWGKGVVDRGEFETMQSMLPVYKQQLLDQTGLPLLMGLDVHDDGTL